MSTLSPIKLISPFTFAFFIICVGRLGAQDTRKVTEPHFPKPCVTLDAQLSAPGGILSDYDEHRPDTERIQSAIDHCKKRQAVKLRAVGGHNIFLAAPLYLKSGVTLLIDANAALFASRNPRDYDITPGSCGIVDEHGHGCKPFILADHAPNAAIMGDGVIDGRGGAKLLGQDVSWWDLAHTAKITDKSQNCTRILIVRESDNFTLYRDYAAQFSELPCLGREIERLHGVGRENRYAAHGTQHRWHRSVVIDECVDPLFVHPSGRR